MAVDINHTSDSLNLEEFFFKKISLGQTESEMVKRLKEWQPHAWEAAVKRNKGEV